MKIIIGVSLFFCYFISLSPVYSINKIKYVDNGLKSLNLLENPFVKTIKEDSTEQFATIYLYRPKKFGGSKVEYDIHIDDEIFFQMKSDTRYKHKITKEGKIEVWAKGYKKKISIDVKYGEKYYIKCEIVWGASKGLPKLSLVDPTLGEKDYNLTDQY